jgi:hypothetical protein
MIYITKTLNHAHNGKWHIAFDNLYNKRREENQVEHEHKYQELLTQQQSI